MEIRFQTLIILWSIHYLDIEDHTTVFKVFLEVLRPELPEDFMHGEKLASQIEGSNNNFPMNKWIQDWLDFFHYENIVVTGMPKYHNYKVYE